LSINIITINEKVRRHSGRVAPSCYSARKEILIEQGIEPQYYLYDWKDYGDVLRGSNDRKMLRDEHMSPAKFFEVKK
jgi:hypothetical protein